MSEGPVRPPIPTYTHRRVMTVLVKYDTPQHANRVKRVNKEAVGISRNVLDESQLVQCGLPIHVPSSQPHGRARKEKGVKEKLPGVIQRSANSKGEEIGNFLAGIRTN